MSSFKTFILVACIQQLTGLFGQKAKRCTGLLALLLPASSMSPPWDRPLPCDWPSAHCMHKVASPSESSFSRK